MATAGITEEDATVATSKTERTEKSNYWKKLLSRYEKRNALLERKQAALVERVRFMECALPSLMMGAVTRGKREPQTSTNNTSSCSRLTSKQSCACCSSSKDCSRRSSSHEEDCPRRNRRDKAEEVGIKIEDVRRCPIHN